MDIRLLSERTAIPVSEIRYILDRELLPMRTWMADETASGRARTFDEYTGVYIASAAWLLSAGCKREVVKDMLSAISRIYPTGRNSLNLPLFAYVCTSNTEARAQYGDRRFVRWLSTRSTELWFDCTTNKSLPLDFKPKAIIELNVGEIRDLVVGRRPSC